LSGGSTTGTRASVRTGDWGHYHGAVGAPVHATASSWGRALLGDGIDRAVRGNQPAVLTPPASPAGPVRMRGRTVGRRLTTYTFSHSPHQARTRPGCWSRTNRAAARRHRVARRPGTRHTRSIGAAGGALDRQQGVSSGGVGRAGQGGLDGASGSLWPAGGGSPIPGGEPDGGGQRFGPWCDHPKPGVAERSRV